ncbi:hypothetical protein MU582_00075 [Nocardioidaceae bacterium SCSIO 66511]|nr:hypothetical protein MU582_00075 [Nocardioidaceae bacterium SCSIO 66511]
MNPEGWIAVSASLIGLLGGMHLLMLYFSANLRPVGAELSEQLTEATVPLSDTTNLWRLWFGFNASHSIGALGFGATYAYLALAQPTALFDGAVLCSIGLAYLVAMLWASLRYWFLAPTVGISIATIAFAVGTASGLTG